MVQQFTTGGLLFVGIGEDAFDVYAPINQDEMEWAGVTTSVINDPDGPPLWYWRPQGWERGDDVKVFRTTIDLAKHIKETRR